MFEGRTRHQLSCSVICSALTRDIVVRLQYLNASYSFIDLAKKITYLLVGTD